MIWFEELTNRKNISRLFSSYEKTFPANERRDKEQFLALADNPSAYVFRIHEDETPIGYLILWQIDDFWFLEHFEVFEEFRNRKFGAEILHTLSGKYPKILLESEPSTLSETAKKRIAFYERNGYSVIDKNYVQPSYGEGKISLKLYLLSSFPVDNPEDYISKIHETVYN